jgi:hypothetical protein
MTAMAPTQSTIRALRAARQIAAAMSTGEHVTSRPKAPVRLPLDARGTAATDIMIRGGRDRLVENAYHRTLMFRAQSN